jgi:hypothetical protein
MRRLLPHSSSASRFTAGPSEFFVLSHSAGTVDESFINTTLSNLEDNSDRRRRMRKVDVRRLLHQVETAPSGSPELDSEFVREQILNLQKFVGDR